MRKWLSLLGFVLWFATGIAVAQQVVIVAVTSNGFGRTEQEAITDAIINGVAQVNGEAIAAKMRVKTESTASTNGEESGRRTIDEDIERRTRGVVMGWKPVSVVGSSAGDLTATVQVNVAVLSRSEQLKRFRLAVVPASRGDPSLSSALVAEVVANLTSSRKFAVMDRKNNEQVLAQLSRIRDGAGALEDQVRLTGELAPDFLTVVNIEPVEKSSGKQVAIATLEIIDYSSRQIKFSEKKSFPLKIDDEFSNRRRVAMLGKGLSRAVIQTVYPPTVVGSEEGFITIGQGSDFFNNGDLVIIKKIGNAIRDPHTGEFLGNDHIDVGKAKVVYVDKRISRAKIVVGSPLNLQLIAESRYQVWRTGQSAEDFFSDAASAASAKGQETGSKRLFPSDDDD